MSTTTHPNDGCMIVVDDPHGYCVPSPGVKIVGRDQGKTLAVVAHRHNRDMDMRAAIGASMLINMGYQRVMELERPRMERKMQEPKVKGHYRKPKRLHKGLRP